MAKKFAIISGIITIAAAVAALVAYLLVGKTNLLDKWELDLEDDEDFLF